ncbi:MAG: hypothetical protein JW795_00200 [Chitinivibrionales bacterium]|nr:hypothetical protein [Chitinivibrionales bacterium]
MIAFVESILFALRPAFSRQATFHWFVIVAVGCIMRSDFFGVSSIIRALGLPERIYPLLLHFFHSTAWNAGLLMQLWWQWVAAQPCEPDVRIQNIFTSAIIEIDFSEF